LTAKSTLIRKRKVESAVAGDPSAMRWMTVAAWGVGLIVGAAVLSAVALWFMRSPMWTIRHVDVVGELTRNNVATIRANTLPKLSGNFFSLNLHQTRQVFESVPWVRAAVVRRIWPDRLVVRLQEHQPAARWMGVDGNESLVNTFGEVFQANLGDVDADALPVFSGPDNQAKQVSQMYQKLTVVFARLERRIVRLDVSGRGSWGLLLDDDTEVTMGRGSEQEVVSRAERFVATVSQVKTEYKTALLQADLRHHNGYAVRLKGVMSVEPSTKKEGK
jgi:cell division protein FtsQ